MKRALFSLLAGLVSLSLAGCTLSLLATPATAATATLTPSGPETMPNSPRPYPTSLTVEMAQQGIAAVVDAPPSITSLAEVQFIITKHTQLAQAAGLSFDHMAPKYVPTDQRWFLVPVQSDGMITGWLQIADSSSLSGWRYGEQPTWDSRYSPSKDTYQYGLPALHDPANHFDVGFENGFPVLIEVTSSGAPQYWNDIAQKSIKVVEGAVLPTETPSPTLRPTDTLVPTAEVPEYNTNRADTADAFTPTTEDQKQATIKDIENSWMLDANNPSIFVVQPAIVNPDKSSYVRLTCIYGQTCLVRASIEQDVVIEGQTYKIYQYIWEVVVNKQHRAVVTTHSTGVIYVQGEQENWEKIASAQNGTDIGFRFETGANPAVRFYGPRELWLANQPRNPQAMEDLKLGILDEDISDNILWGSEVTTVNP